MRQPVSGQQIRTWGFRIASGLLLLLVLLAWLLPVPALIPFASAYLPLWLALLTVLLVFQIALFIQRKQDFLFVFQSEGDGKLSVSKLQLYIWLSVVAFSFSYIAAANYQIWHGLPGQTSVPPALNFPPNVLIALGLSAIVFGTAKAVAVGNQGVGPPPTQTPPDQAQTATQRSGSLASGLVTSDRSDTLDITKIQMLSWTVIGAFMYVADTIATVNLNLHLKTLITGVPDISNAILVLTGISQGTYIGNKLIVPRGPLPAQLAPSQAKAGDTAHVFGSGFGSTGSLLLDGSPIASQSWSDTDIVFVLPANRPGTSTPYKTGDVAKVSVVTGGKSSDNELPLTFA
jgi:hypothetical protein